MKKIFLVLFYVADIFCIVLFAYLSFVKIKAVKENNIMALIGLTGAINEKETIVWLIFALLLLLIVSFRSVIRKIIISKREKKK